LPCRKSLKVGERSLAELVLYKIVVGLEPLEPQTEVERVAAMSERHLIGRGKQIAHRSEIASRVRAAVGDLRSPVERCASAHHHGADGLPDESSPADSLSFRR